MAASRILIDTSVVIEHLRRQNKQKSSLYGMVDDYALYTSTVVEFELYAGAKDPQKRRDVAEVLAWCTILPLTSDVAQAAATVYQQLRATNQLIEVRDIFIAATALTRSLPLMTFNVGHFNRIRLLQILTPPTV